MTKKLYFVILLAIIILLVGFYFASDITNIWISHLAHLGIMTLAGLTIIGFNKKKIPEKEENFFRPNHLMSTMAGVVGLIGVSNFIPVLATKMAGIEITEHLIEAAEFNEIFAIIISLAIFEEILFRRILAQKLYNYLGLRKGIWISALIFSLAHIYSETGLLSAFIGGAVFAYIYLKTKNIYLTIMGHLLYNVLTYFLTPLFIDHYKRINEYPIIISVLIVGFVLIYLSIITLRRAKKVTIEIKPADNNGY